MTRIEKYREYRKEISNMNFESLTEKNKTAKQVENIHSGNLSNKLSYEKLMIVHESLDEGEVSFKRKKYFHLTKYEIFYFLIAFIVIIIFTILLIFVGIKTWR